MTKSNRVTLLFSNIQKTLEIHTIIQNDCHLHRHSNTIYLQCTSKGPSARSSCDRNFRRKSNSDEAISGTPLSGQPVKWNWRTQRDFFWKQTVIGCHKHLFSMFNSRYFITHYHVKWALYRLKLPANRLFVQQVAEGDNKENIKAGPL